jgi:ubiquinone/menaquinone biosynthesis C-methylase UbiE
MKSTGSQLADRRSSSIDVFPTCEADMNNSENASGRFIPALSHDALTPAYDFLIALVMPERRFKTALIDAAAIDSGHRVLDVACGTGTLLQMVAERHPSVALTGIDIDPKVLARAKAKIGTKAVLELASATALPFASETFDIVLSSLAFHHLTREEKAAAMREVYRVLRSGGEFHLGDFGPPHARLMRIASFLTEKIGREHVADNYAGLLVPMLHYSGFREIEESGRVASIFGTLRTLRAVKSLKRGVA